MCAYISYYSKPRNTFDTSVDITQHLQQNQNRIVTKVADTNEQRMTDRQRTMFDKLNSMYYNSPPCPTTYTQFTIPKASGGYRTIEAPNDTLKLIQRRIVNAFNEGKVLPHNAAHGFVKHRNCLTALQTHQAKGARWFLKLDIKDFFPSIKQDPLIYRISQEIFPFATSYRQGCLNDTVLTEIIKRCCKDGCLPQGSPASPMLSNLYMVPVDYWITKTLPTLTYTRYADDMLFSSASHFDWKWVTETVMSILLTKAALRLNTQKIRYGSFNGANWNLGLMYNNESNITVGFKNKKLIKNKVHNMYRDKDNMSPDEWWTATHTTAGLLSYYKSIEPEYFTKLINKFLLEGKEELFNLTGCELI